MRKLNQLPDREYILGNFFIVANKLNKMMDRELEEFDITTKQLILSAVVDTLFEDSPAIKEVAYEMGSSHQNVKQIALKLHKKGLLQFEKDKSDNRLTRLKISEDSQEFWKSTHKKGNKFTNLLFDGIDNEDLLAFRKTFGKIIDNISKMESIEQSSRG
jgi:DNA-binding MarR family transcriptional regulator